LSISLPPTRLRDRLFMRVFSRLFVFTILFEDTEVEERFFAVDERSRVLGVSAAGCGMAGLLARRPARIDAVDSNRHHLALAALKMSAARRLDSYDELLALLGDGRHPDARRVVSELTAPLPDWIRDYWARHYRIFTKGLYEHGLLAASMRLMRARLGVDEGWYRNLSILPLPEREAEATRVYRQLLDQPLVAALARSPLQLLAQGINFQQRDRNLRSAGTNDMRDVVLRFVVRGVSTDLARNWIFWHCLLGKFNVDDQEALPHYLRRTHHARSVGAPTETAFHRASFVDVLGAAPPGTWTHYNFSDALDWIPDRAQEIVLGEILRTSVDGALLLNRSVDRDCMVARHGLERHFERLADASDAATAIERSRLYERIDIYRIVH
jgi:S-adenosylmethionine-diacylglycerol 3-amino-3-carboxypropyl transferase